MTERKRRAPRDQKRIDTINERKGPGWFKENASRAGKHATTKFTSASGKAAADARWAAIRAAKREAQ